MKEGWGSVGQRSAAGPEAGKGQLLLSCPPTPMLVCGHHVSKYFPVMSQKCVFYVKSSD